MSKIIVLSSGGLDSAVCTGIAVNNVGAENVHSLVFLYGQKHGNELVHSKYISDYYGIKHKLIDIRNLGLFDNSSCTLLEQNEEEVPVGSYKDQLALGNISTYVPFRNGLFLSMAASYAYSLVEGTDEVAYIYIGAHADDAAGNAYADCTRDFIQSIDSAIYKGTYGKVCICAPFAHMHKKDIVAKGDELEVPFRLTWSCYKGDAFHCGECGTCIDRKKAFELSKVKDPTVYMK